jgi:hypothetical protein
MAAADIERPGVAQMSRLAALALAIVLCAGAARGADKYRPTPFGPTAADKIAAGARAAQAVQGNFNVGEKYSVTVTCGGVVQAYDGKLLKVSDHWIVLRDYSILTSTPLAAQMGKIPLVGGWVRRASEKPGQVDRWLPREAVRVVSHHRADNPVTLRTPLGSQPPPNQHGRIALVRGGKVVTPDGELAASGNDNLTIVNHDESGSHRELVPRREVLCVSYFGRCLDPSEKE